MGIVKTRMVDILLNYIGSVWGGMLTLYGVIWTFKYSERTSAIEENKRDSPNLQFDFIQSKHSFYSKGEITLLLDEEMFNTHDMLNHDLELEIHNVGLGPAYKAKIEELNVTEVEYYDNNGLFRREDKTKSYFLGNQFIDIIHSKKTLLLMLMLPRRADQFKNIQSMKMCISFKLNYTNINFQRNFSDHVNFIAHIHMDEYGELISRVSDIFKLEVFREIEENHI